MKISSILSCIVTLATLAACGNSQEIQASPSPNVLAQGLEQHSVGQGVDAEGNHFDIIDDKLYTRLSPATEGCLALFTQVDGAIEAGLSSKELNALMNCYVDKEVFAQGSALHRAGCNMEAESDEPAPCEQLRAQFNASRLQCKAQEDAYANLEAWETAEMSMRQALADHCYARFDTGV